MSPEETDRAYRERLGYYYSIGFDSADAEFLARSDVHRTYIPGNEAEADQLDEREVEGRGTR